MIQCYTCIANLSLGLRILTTPVSCPHRQSVEISQALRQTFEAAVLTELFPQSRIDVYVQVLQSDGG